MKFIFIFFIATTTAISACDTDNQESNNEDETTTPNNTMASVVSVSSSGAENNYSFSVGISSPDTGCDQYANWWEVITEDGTLLYRRILAHSHVNEQPFVRSGGTIDISSDQVVIVRTHMNTSGYGINANRGSIDTGFSSTTLDKDFAQNLATVEPLPNDCAF